MKKFVLLLVISSLLMIGVSANAQGNSQSFLIIANGNIPNNIERQVSRAGGTITNTISEAGLVVAESANPNFASQISGVRAVVPNLVWQMVQPTENIAFDAANPPFSGDDDIYFDLQWGHDAVNAPEAWENGSCGAGALVAVLDGGFDTDHPDLVPNIVGTYDATGEGVIYELPDTFSHGTHVAGTIAAADNGFGIIGVAPCAHLLLVKVLGDGGSGSFEDVVEGIIYAANYGGVDVINMSLGADIPQRGVEDDPATEDIDETTTASEVAALRVMMNRAVNYAAQQGVTVIVAAGNDARDLDHDADVTVFPASMPNAISISATAPQGWALDPLNANLDFLASYSNYGRSGVDFAAPGGDYVYPGDEICVAGVVVQYCFVLDYVFSTGNGGWYWSVGTSMAAPHAAGIAALIVAENGGSMHPAQVRAEMQRRSEDLGQRGNDPIYGAGRVHSGYYGE